MADRRRRLAAIPLVLLAAVVLGLASVAGPALAQGTGSGAGGPGAPVSGQRPTVGVSRKQVGLKRAQVGLVRRVVPFDGQIRRNQASSTQVTVTLDTQVLFDFDQATLTPAAQTSLRALADELNRNLASPAVAVDGYTDSVGTDQHNVDLSTRRATAVRDFLAPLMRVPVTFTVTGHGPADPVASNTRPDGSDDPDGRRQNRRVNVTYQPRATPN